MRIKGWDVLLDIVRSSKEDKDTREFCIIWLTESAARAASYEYIVREFSALLENPDIPVDFKNRISYSIPFIKTEVKFWKSIKEVKEAKKW